MYLVHIAAVRTRRSFTTSCAGQLPHVQGKTGAPPTAAEQQRDKDKLADDGQTNGHVDAQPTGLAAKGVTAAERAPTPGVPLLPPTPASHVIDAKWVVIVSSRQLHLSLLSPECTAGWRHTTHQLCSTLNPALGVCWAAMLGSHPPLCCWRCLSKDLNRVRRRSRCSCLAQGLLVLTAVFWLFLIEVMPPRFGEWFLYTIAGLPLGFGYSFWRHKNQQHKNENIDKARMLCRLSADDRCCVALWSLRIYPCNLHTMGVDTHQPVASSSRHNPYACPQNFVSHTVTYQG